MEWYPAPDIEKKLKIIVKALGMSYVELSRIICFRSEGSVSRARARIWSFPKVWQQALNLPSHYIIEVVSKHFDHLSSNDQERVLIHELLHIPKNFSGSLVPHRTRYRRLEKEAERLYQIYAKNHSR
mgnify:FL=1